MEILAFQGSLSFKGAKLYSSLFVVVTNKSMLTTTSSFIFVVKVFPSTSLMLFIYETNHRSYAQLSHK